MEHLLKPDDHSIFNFDITAFVLEIHTSDWKIQLIPIHIHRE